MSRFQFPWKTEARIAADVNDEFEFHVVARAAELEAEGLEPADALRQANREFGDRRQAAAYCRRVDGSSERAARRSERLGEVWLDLVYVFRSLRRTPAVAFTIVVILGVSLAVSLMGYAMADELLVRQLPVADPSALVLVHGELQPTGDEVSTSIADYRDLARQTRTLTGLAGLNGRVLALGVGGTPIAVQSQIVTANYFDVLGLVPALGRFFGPGADDPGTAPTAVISDQLWRERFQASPTVIGSAIRVNGQPITIIGVAPPAFAGPFIGFRFDLFVALGGARALDRTVDPADRSRGFLELFGRVRPGVLPGRAADELTGLAVDLNRSVQSPRDRRFRAAPMTGLDTELRGGVVQVVTLVLSLAGLALFAASLNAGGLLLARGMSRQKEFALRQALGSGRGRLVRLQLLEAGVLVAGAAIIGLILTLGLRHAASLLVPALPIRLDFEFALNGRAALVLAGLVLVATVATGLLPAVAAARADPAQRLRVGGTMGGLDGRLRRWFISGQVAVTFAMLVGAGLLTRTVLKGQAAEPSGAEAIATLPLDVSFANYDESAGRAFYRELLARVQAFPGATGVAYAARLPLGFGNAQAEVQIPGVDPAPGETGFRVETNRVSAGWVETTGLPMVRGRVFSPADLPGGPSVVMINQTMANRFWPNANPLQQAVVVNGRRSEIVGVTDDSRFALPGRPNLARIYLSADQVYSPRAILMVRGPVTSRGIAGLLAGAVAELGPDLPLDPVGTLAANVGLAYFPQRLLGGATIGVAILTLVLAAFGLYGLLAYWVTMRRTELGVRMALGADAASIRGLAMRQGLVPIIWGMAAGVALAAALGMALRSFLIGVSPFDPAAYLVGGVAFLGVASAACLIPASRAARLPPTSALRGG